MTDLPEPLVPADVDLRDYDYMPLHGERLFSSDTWILCDDAERVAALRLWWKSWHQEPPASLPDNERLLADMAGYGVAIREFRKVRENAMRGWIKCTDGRLYHPVVAEIALDAWAAKRKKATDNEADRERKRLKRGGLSGGQTFNSGTVSGGQASISGGQSGGIPPENALKGSRREVEENSSEPEAGSSEPPIGSPTVVASPVTDADPLDIPIRLDRTEPGEAIRLWNEQAKSLSLPTVQRLTVSRRKALKARLTECGGIEGWKAALAKVASSPFLCGNNDRGWRADIDFMLRETRFTSLLEGKYDGTGNRTPGATRNGWAQLLAEELGNGAEGLDLPGR